VSTYQANHLSLMIHHFVVSPGEYDDLYSFDPGNMTWTSLSSAIGTRPSARCSHGFTSAGGKLYVHGGNVNINGICVPSLE
jgi:hypothetical protein